MPTGPRSIRKMNVETAHSILVILSPTEGISCLHYVAALERNACSEFRSCLNRCTRHMNSCVGGCNRSDLCAIRINVVLPCTVLIFFGHWLSIEVDILCICAVSIVFPHTVT